MHLEIYSEPKLLQIRIRQWRKHIFSNRSAATLFESMFLILCILDSHNEFLTHNLGLGESRSNC